MDNFLRGRSETWEVIIVVEKSEDGTLDLARQAAATTPALRIIGNEVRRGKGYAVRTGMLAATGDLVFFMDADLSTPLDEVPRFLGHFQTHPDTDILIGNRAHRDSDIVKSQSILRRSMGQMFNGILRTIAPVQVRDTQCGFKAFRKRVVEPLFGRARTDGFAFDVEILLLAQQLGYKAEDLPVTWINSEGSKVDILRDSWQMLNDVIRLRLEMTRENRPIRSPGETQ